VCLPVPCVPVILEQLIITTLAEQLQDCGIQALTIHGRTRSQMLRAEKKDDLLAILERCREQLR